MFDSRAGKVLAIYYGTLLLMRSILLVGQEVRFSILKQVFEPPMDHHEPRMPMTAFKHTTLGLCK